jgi:spermidine/putrescine transport system ATP-binding protein/putrescine transport system ATP-binding protein
MSEHFIDIKNISRHFGSVKAVDNVSFSIKKGEFFSLLGPSGCGKTTLLRLLAGFESANQGEIYIDGMDVTTMPPNLRPTNMVFQNYAIFPHINVKKNIEFGMRKEKLSKQELDDRVQEVLSLVKLEGYEERFSNQLSGGQRQRIALARALIKRPKVLLLDEPLGALDKKLRDEMQIELRNLQKAVGITFVFVTHDQGESISMSDRVAVMNDGQIQQISDPHDLYYNPQNIFVSDFIGTTNFLSSSTGASNGEEIMVKIESIGEFSIRNKLNISENNSDTVCSIRPEAITLSPTPIEKGDITLEGKIENSSYYGELTSFYVKIDGAEKPLIASSQRFDNNSFQDNKCYLSINFEDINLLKKE